MIRSNRFSRGAAAFGVTTAALLGAARLEAGEMTRVEGLQCAQAWCQERSGAIDVSGKDPSQANSRLSLVVLDEAKAIVVRQPVAAQADGSFRVAITAGVLAPGRYRFGLLTSTQPARAVAGGDFIVARRSTSVEPVAAEDVQPLTSRPVRPTRSRTVRPMASQDIEPVQADTVQPVQPAEEVVPSSPAAPAAPAETRRKKGFSGFLDRLNANLENQQRRSSIDKTAADLDQEQPSPAARPSAGGAYSVFFRTFGLAIPGVAYTTDNYATNTRTVTVASGTVTKSAVRINPDGTYIWNSAWDGRIIRGRWRPAGSGIILVNAQSGRDWRVERMAQPSGAAEVTVWDQNSIWYNGTPLGK